MEDLCLDHAATLGTEKVKELEARKILVESEVRHYQKLMNAKVVEIRENVSTNSHKHRGLKQFDCWTR